MRVCLISLWSRTNTWARDGERHSNRYLIGRTDTPMPHSITASYHTANYAVLSWRLKAYAQARKVRCSKVANGGRTYVLCKDTGPPEQRKGKKHAEPGRSTQVMFIDPAGHATFGTAPASFSDAHALRDRNQRLTSLIDHGLLDFRTPAFHATNSFCSRFRFPTLHFALPPRRR